MSVQVVYVEAGAPIRRVRLMCKEVPTDVLLVEQDDYNDEGGVEFRCEGLSSVTVCASVEDAITFANQIIRLANQIKEKE